jgi:hypothetical protein
MLIEYYEEPEHYESRDYSCYEHAYNIGESPFKQRHFLGMDARNPEIETILKNPEMLKSKMNEIDKYLEGVKDGI